MASWNEPGWYLTDAEREEEIRCAALGMEGPNAKLYRGEALAEQADLARKRARENSEAEK